tara:strand:- start:156 stop:317 length:162 start_codon:yes stop_codon:yes gene_type:complete
MDENSALLVVVMDVFVRSVGHAIRTGSIRSALVRLESQKYGGKRSFSSFIVCY